MTDAYRLVQWNRHKRVYDLVLAGAVVGYLAVFMVGGFVLFQPPNEISPPILLMRALGSLAIVLLHVVLVIGALARLDARWVPLLYNRRHLGVTLFLVALLHGLVAIGFYGGFGVESPLTAVLAGGAGAPWELFGFLALVVFFVMAATSHDFWLANLGPGLWKSLHMGVYAAYALVVLHVAFGALQSERHWALWALLGIGVATVVSLHVAAGVREWRRDRAGASLEDWVDVGPADEIPEDRARVVCLRGRERIAVFRYDGKISALSNVCAHQGGPLGEGKIVDGCVTCPWHGYQYRPEDGQSPPPYAEKVPTYEVRVEGGRVLVNPEPRAPGTPVAPARVSGDDGGGSGDG